MTVTEKIKNISKGVSGDAGFTLIELIMVIVILGILAAVALPKFVNLQDDAQQASVSGVAGNMGSASAINYAGCAVNGNSAEAGKCVIVGNCTDIANLMEDGANLVSGYTITGGTVGQNATAQCSIFNGAKTATFTIHGT